MSSILVSGSHGLIGSALVRALSSGGDRVVPLVRPASAPAPQGLVWDPATGRIDAGGLEGLDAVVHLAGENIAGGRWTAARRDRIRRSRIDGTALLAGTLARLARPPRVFVCASAVGYYGDRGDEVLHEDSGSGAGFLADLCRDWEAAASPARAAGIRVVYARSGTVLSAAGGMLPRVLPLFRLGLGGVLGSGAQYLSWIALADHIGALQYILGADGIAGPVNLVAPHAVTNREFTRALGRALRRPTPLPVPAAALRLAFGRLADEALLASTRVEPARLLASGYRFRYPDLGAALAALLHRHRG
jgi:uncharacterized protein (TIGR01777 family)